MTVRVWMKPSELGECGYCIDFPEADNYSYQRFKDGTHLLILTSANRADTGEVGRVQEDRWDAVIVMEDEVETTTEAETDGESDG